jgi:Tat protein secretion system quality control protein TatD with DNase activity
VLASLKDVPVGEMAEATWANATAVFRLPDGAGTRTGPG